MSTVTGRSAFANYLYNCTHSAKLKLSCVFYWIDELFEAVCSKLAIADLDFYKPPHNLPTSGLLCKVTIGVMVIYLTLHKRLS